ncbi:MAG TPA: hypothetical protein VG708_06860 [Mycobacteriales bacterium]|nr:hypothetical protein [Mycobacteriales bacterium]
MIVVVGLVIAAVVTTAAVLATDRGDGTRHSSPPTGTGASHRASVNQVRAAAIRQLLRRRSHAVLAGDRRQLLATIDPAARQFRRDQARMLANLRQVPLASWTYSFDPAQQLRPTAAQLRLGVPTWSPRQFVLHYRLRGFDRRPTVRRQFPTFVRRDGQWYLASLTDFAVAGRVSATDLWDYAPVRVLRRPDVLVMGPPAMLPTMQTVLADAVAAIPRVTAVWGRGWARRVVIEAPSSQPELRAITGAHGNLSNLVALTSAEIHSAPGRPEPAGDRIAINPALWPRLGPLGRRVVLTHEVTHVATRAATGSQTPRWLAEGFANYVGFLGTGVAPTVAAAELAGQVRADGAPRQLPGRRAFAGGSSRFTRAYQEGWLACRYIAARYGQATLVRFYRAVGGSRQPTAAAVRAAMRRLLHTDPRSFTAAWRRFVVQELA